MSKELRFLIVDDFSTMRRIVRNLLKESGYADADEAEDGVIALQKLRNSSFDFVVSDINMPNMNGLELAAELKSLPGAKHIPLILLTSRTLTEESKAAREHFFAGYLTKPFARDDLLDCISLVLQGKKQIWQVEKTSSRSQDILQHYSSRSESQEKTEYKVLVLERLVTVMNLKQEEAEKILDDCLPDIAENFETVEWMARENNMQELLQALHIFKGAAGSFQMNEIAENAQRAEAAAVKGDPEELRNRVAEIINWLAKLY